MIDLKREADVFVLRFDVAENRFRPDNLAAWHEALDEVEQRRAGCLPARVQVDLQRRGRVVAKQEPIPLPHRLKRAEVA